MDNNNDDMNCSDDDDEATFLSKLSGQQDEDEVDLFASHFDDDAMDDDAEVDLLAGKDGRRIQMVTEFLTDRDDRSALWAALTEINNQIRAQPDQTDYGHKVGGNTEYIGCGVASWALVAIRNGGTESPPSIEFQCMRDYLMSIADMIELDRLLALPFNQRGVNSVDYYKLAAVVLIGLAVTTTRVSTPGNPQRLRFSGEVFRCDHVADASVCCFPTDGWCCLTEILNNLLTNMNDPISAAHSMIGPRFCGQQLGSAQFCLLQLMPRSLWQAAQGFAISRYKYANCGARTMTPPPPLRPPVVKVIEEEELPVATVRPLRKPHRKRPQSSCLTPNCPSRADPDLGKKMLNAIDVALHAQQPIGDKVKLHVFAALPIQPSDGTKMTRNSLNIACGACGRGSLCLVCLDRCEPPPMFFAKYHHKVSEPRIRGPMLFCNRECYEEYTSNPKLGERASFTDINLSPELRAFNVAQKRILFASDYVAPWVPKQ